MSEAEPLVPEEEVTELDREATNEDSAAIQDEHTLVNGQASDLESMIVTYIDTSHIEIEDGKPVDNLFSEKQQRLLVESLYASWQGPGEGRPFMAFSNVGLFYGVHLPPYVPDVFVSVDVEHPGNFDEKKNRTYFVWEYGKLPEVVIEIVSNRKGGELTDKLAGYARVGIPYYVVHDPHRQLGEEILSLFELRGGQYEPLENGWLPPLNLGLRLWQGSYEQAESTWLRWYDAEGTLLPTGVEAANAAHSLAEQEHTRAEQEHERAEQLAEQLRTLGIEPTE